MINIHTYTPPDFPALLRLSRELFRETSDYDLEELEQELKEVVDGDSFWIFFCYGWWKAYWVYQYVDQIRLCRVSWDKPCMIHRGDLCRTNTSPPMNRKKIIRALKTTSQISMMHWGMIWYTIRQYRVSKFSWSIGLWGRREIGTLFDEDIM